MYACYIQSLRTLASSAGWFESYPVKNRRRRIFAWCGSNKNSQQDIHERDNQWLLTWQPKHLWSVIKNAGQDATLKNKHGGNTKIHTCAVDGAGTALNGCRPRNMAFNRAVRMSTGSVSIELRKRKSKYFNHRRMSPEVSNCLSVPLQRFVTPGKSWKCT